MSQRNGDKSRFQINRKRVVKRRAKVRAMLAAAQGGDKPAAQNPARPDVPTAGQQ
jgi:hypothetical protein